MNKIKISPKSQDDAFTEEGVRFAGEKRNYWQAKRKGYVYGFFALVVVLISGVVIKLFF